jgi:hypothetical protein
VQPVARRETTLHDGVELARAATGKQDPHDEDRPRREK